MDKIEELKKLLNEAIEAKSNKDITVCRGRLIKALKKEIANIKSGDLSENDEKKLKELEDYLSEEISSHKDNLSVRYKEEFRKKKATVPAIFTVLPRGVGLAFKKILNCIDELKQAKTNKQRIFGVLDVVKSIGLFAATPFIFAGKFIVKHWYLLLLLLALLKMPHLPGKDKSNDNDNNYDRQPQEEYAVDTVEEDVPEPNNVRVDVPGKVINEVLEEDQGKQVIPEVQPAPLGIKEVANETLNPLHRPIVDLSKVSEHTVDVPQVGPVADNSPSLDIKDVADRTLNPLQVPKPNLTEVTEKMVDVPKDVTVDSVVNPSNIKDIADNVGDVLLTEDQRDLATRVSTDLLDNLEGQYNFFIADRHPDILVVNSPEEYVDAVKNINPDVNINLENAADYYLRFKSMINLTEQPVVWPSIDPSCRYYATTEELANHIVSGEDELLTNYVVDFANTNSLSLESFGSIFESLGITGSLGTVAFILYEGLQWGLAPSTGGLSLALPG